VKTLAFAAVVVFGLTGIASAQERLPSQASTPPDAARFELVAKGSSTIRLDRVSGVTDYLLTGSQVVGWDPIRNDELGNPDATAGPRFQVIVTDRPTQWLLVDTTSGRVWMLRIDSNMARQVSRRWVLLKNPLAER
jgi:hypothetical protein